MTAILDSNQCCRFCGPTPKPLGQWQLYIHFAEAVGFEPTEPFGSLVFKTSAIDQLCQTSNHIFIFLAEAEGFEPSEPFGSAR